MRQITVRIPRLPVVAPAPEPDSGVTFGPLGWEWASEGDNGDEPTVFPVPLDLVHTRAFNFALATCPGAVSWRLDPAPSPPPDYALYSMSSAAIVQALTSSGTADLYAMSATGAELGPIVIESVA
jgi:hypothetical protein